jgi:hypothetical protein
MGWMEYRAEALRLAAYFLYQVSQLNHIAPLVTEDGVTK